VPDEVLAAATDDAWLVERAGGTVVVVPWAGDNLKVTNPVDLRVVEQLERSREQIVSDVRVQARNGQVQLKLVGDGDLSVARWGARRQGDVFAQAFERELEVAAG